MEHEFTYLGKLHKVKLEHKIVSVNGKEGVEVEYINLGPNSLFLTVGDKVLTVYVVADKNKSYVFVDGDVFTFDRGVTESKVMQDISLKLTGNTVVSSIPGTLVKLFVSVGCNVKAGETVAIVEAMKMENELKSPLDGVVRKLNFKEGAQVDAFTPIMELETCNEKV